MNKRKRYLNILTAVFALMLIVGGYKVVRYIQDKSASDRVIEDMTVSAVTVRETRRPVIASPADTGEAGTQDTGTVIAAETDDGGAQTERTGKPEPTGKPKETVGQTKAPEAMNTSGAPKTTEAAARQTEAPEATNGGQTPEATGTVNAPKATEADAGQTEVPEATGAANMPQETQRPAGQTETPPETDTGIKTEPIEEAPIEVDFKVLSEMNPDIVGWLYCEDVLSEPVMQTDDNSFYINHAPDGTFNNNGSVFLDCCLEKDLTDKNVVMYGHNMRSGVRFGKLANYKEPDFFEGHEVIYLLTPQGDYVIELIAGYISTAGSDYYMQPDNDEEMAERIAKAKAGSTFESEVDFESGDTIVTLSTCSYEWSNARYLLLGKLIPIGTD